MKNNPVSHDRILSSVRFDQDGIKAPSPVSAGISLINMGLSLMLQPVTAPLRQRFTRLERRIVLTYTGQHNYTREHVRIAWTSLFMIGTTGGLTIGAMVATALFLLNR